MPALHASAVTVPGRKPATLSGITLPTQSRAFFFGLGALLFAMMLSFMGWYVHFARDVARPPRTHESQPAETLLQTEAPQGPEEQTESPTASSVRGLVKPGIEPGLLPSSQSLNTPARVVAGFYQALAKGDGHGAAAFIVPSKQGANAFSATGMSRFYGTMKQPLHIDSLRQIDAQRLEVRYRYRVTSTTCEGTAIVTTVLLDDRTMIRSIQANC